MSTTTRVFVKPSEVREVLNISRSTALRLESDPTAGFPQRRKITPGGHVTGWVRTELLDWAASREKVR